MTGNEFSPKGKERETVLSVNAQGSNMPRLDIGTSQASASSVPMELTGSLLDISRFVDSAASDSHNHGPLQVDTISNSINSGVATATRIAKPSASHTEILHLNATSNNCDHNEDCVDVGSAESNIHPLADQNSTETGEHGTRVETENTDGNEQHSVTGSTNHQVPGNRNMNDIEDNNSDNDNNNDNNNNASNSNGTQNHPRAHYEPINLLSMRPRDPPSFHNLHLYAMDIRELGPLDEQRLFPEMCIGEDPNATHILRPAELERRIEACAEHLMAQQQQVAAAVGAHPKLRDDGFFQAQGQQVSQVCEAEMRCYGRRLQSKMRIQLHINNLTARLNAFRTYGPAFAVQVASTQRDLNRALNEMRCLDWGILIDRLCYMRAVERRMNKLLAHFRQLHARGMIPT